MQTRTRIFRRPLAAAAVTSIALSLVGASLAGAVDPGQQSSFGRMFPGQDPFRPSDDSLTKLVQTQRDKGLAQLDNKGVPAGFTYLGQFIDHDLTRNTQALPSGPFDPTTLKNFRTAAFDLDSVYGQGPNGDEASRVQVRLGRSSVNTIEVVGGLDEGDRVILSDMSSWDAVDRIRLD